MNTDAVSAMIEEVIDNFDFDTVRKVMLFLDWRWGTEKTGSVPSSGRLVSCARDLLRSAAELAVEYRCHTLEGTGGFCATAGWDENLGVTYLKLAFELTDWLAERVDG